MQAGEDVNLAVLEWRNTPQDNIGSQVQLLMGRRTRTHLPTAHTLLQPQLVPENTLGQLEERQKQQEKFYNRTAKSLPKLKPGDVVRMSTNQGWRPAVVQRHAKLPRSYIVHSAGRDYRRNRRDLLLTGEQEPSQVREPESLGDLLTLPETDNTDITRYAAPADKTPPPTMTTPAKTKDVVKVTLPQPSPKLSRVSGRLIKKPTRFQE